MNTRRRLQKATLAEVAALAGVSTATVSRVFSGMDRVSEPVRQRVRDAASTLDWIPHPAGRALASSRTHIAGAIIPTLDNEIFARQVNGLQKAFSENGITLFLGCSNYDPSESLLQVRAMLARGVEAIAIVGEDHPPELFEALAARHVPYVVTYGFRRESPHPCIGFDNQAAFETITDHVLSLGHRRVAVILQPTAGNSRAAARLAGVRSALDGAGLVLAEDSLHIGPSGLHFGAEAFRLLMRLPRSRRPTGIVCGNDMLALGALGAARSLGLSAPGDFSITGFDDLAIASFLEPRLTTMSVDNRLIGDTAARYLLRRLINEDAEPVEIAPTMHIRNSTGIVPDST